MECFIQTSRLELRILNELHAPEVLQFITDYKEYFEAYEAEKPTGYYTLSYQQECLKIELKSFLNHTYLRYYVFTKKEPEKIIGTVSFSNILSHPFHSVRLGYRFSPEYQHQGYATEAVSTLCYKLFTQNHTHRINAYVLPDNQPSKRLLERIGFECEGLNREFIHINGAYRDHLHYALVNHLPK